MFQVLYYVVYWLYTKVAGLEYMTNVHTAWFKIIVNHITANENHVNAHMNVYMVHIHEINQRMIKIEERLTALEQHIVKVADSFRQSTSASINTAQWQNNAKSTSPK